MTTSNIEPQTIVPDWGTLRHGKLDILVNWAITSVIKQDDMGNEFTEWRYESVRLNWILPDLYESDAAIQAYLDANYSTGENILGWAQATKVNKSVLGL